MPPYGRLEITVTGDTRELERAIAKSATTAGQNAAKSISGSIGGAVKAFTPILGSLGKAAATGLTGATVAAAGFGVASFRAAARVGEMDASLQALAKANNLSYKEMQASVKQIRSTGIEAGVAQGLVAKFAQNQLDLSKSTNLARVAQDAAVISGRNSTEVLDDLVHGITTQNSLVLRNAGINVQAGKAMDDYAKSVGKSRAQLSESERAQAVLNAVLNEGKNVAGAYAAAMEEPGKVLRSFPRLLDDIKISVGTGLVQAFGPAILQSYKLTKAFSEQLAEGGKLNPLFTALGDAVQRLTAPLAPLLERWTKWVTNLQPDQIERATDAVKKFGPAVMIGAGALTAITAPAILGGLPVIGPMIGSMTAPAMMAGKALLSVAQGALAAIPGLGGLAPAAGTVGSALGSLALPVAAIGAALVLMWFNSEKFRSAVIALGRAILSALQPAISALMVGFRILAPIVGQIAGILGDMFGGIIKALLPLLGPLGQLVGVILVAAFKLLGLILGTILVPVLRILAAVITVVVQVIAAVLIPALTWLINIITSVIKWIMGGSPGLIPAFNALTTVMRAVAAFLIGPMSAAFGALASAISAAWSWVTSATASAWAVVASVVAASVSRASATVASGMSTIGATVNSGWTWVRNTTSTLLASTNSVILAGWTLARTTTASLWGQIGSVIAGAWTNIRNNSYANGTALTGWMSWLWGDIQAKAAAGWRGIVNAISSAWQAVQNAVAGPARWVVNSIINPLIKGINVLLKAVNIGELAPIPAFAGGGRIPGGWGGGDRHLILAEAGEWMLTKHQARAIGYRNLAQLPRYAEGGEVGRYPHPSARMPSIGNVVGGLKDLGAGFARITRIDQLASMGKDLLEGFGGFLSWVAAQAFEKLAEPLKKAVEPWTTDPQIFPKQWIGKTVIKAIEAAVEFIMGKAMPEYGGGPGVAAMAAEVIRNFPQLSITSAFRPGDPGYHGQGLARDLGGPVSVMNAAGRWMAERMTSMLLEGIHNPTLSVKNYKPVPSSFWGGGTWAGHADHIHMAAKESDGGPAVSFGGGPGNLRGIVDAVARAFGVGWATDLAMRRLNVESGFRADAVNRWDINWQRGTPSVGFAQIIGPTFAAYAGPYRNKGPFLYGVSLDPMAQIYTMFAYSIARYGRGGLARAWGGTQGYAAGGIVSEPVIGMGLRSGTAYSFAERGPELVSPLAGPGVYTPGGGGRTVINVYPQRGQDERAIAAAVSRELAWAAAGGAP